MGPASRRRIAAALSAVGDDEADRRLCAVCALLLGVSGAAIAVVSERGHRGVLCSSNPAAAALEELQVTIGEGPGVDAHRLGVPVTDADLAASDVSRWLAFCAPAIAAGAAAVFAFPLRVGAVQLGTLTFNHAHPGRLTDEQFAGALFMVGIVTQSVLTIQAKAPRGAVAAALEALAGDGAEVHQAAGMLAVRLGVGVGEALVRLRALAYAEGRSVADIAHDVVAGGPPVIGW
ncbi:MAG TPA: ANTAR domain-containing protein [Acidimicrobiales bacterium]|nr:ANTAR domain-containing protein [Acidimicrobiales bacterium]